jgi:hypothetical protein
MRGRVTSLTGTIPSSDVRFNSKSIQHSKSYECDESDPEQKQPPSQLTLTLPTPTHITENDTIDKDNTDEDAANNDRTKNDTTKDNTTDTESDTANNENIKEYGILNERSRKMAAKLPP